MEAGLLTWKSIHPLRNGPLQTARPCHCQTKKIVLKKKKRNKARILESNKNTMNIGKF